MNQQVLQIKLLTLQQQFHQQTLLNQIQQWHRQKRIQHLNQMKQLVILQITQQLFQLLMQHLKSTTKQVILLSSIVHSSIKYICFYVISIENGNGFEHRIRLYKLHVYITVLYKSQWSRGYKVLNLSRDRLNLPIVNILLHKLGIY